MSLDADHRRRLEHASGLVRFLLPFSAAWALLSLFLGAYVSALGATIASLGFVFAILFERRIPSLWLRSIWLLTTDLGMFLATIATHPDSYTAFLLVFRATIPISVFSPKEPQLLRWGLVMTPILIWFATWWVGFQVLADFEIGEDLARRFFAPLTGISVFAILLFEFAYYDRLHQSQVADLEAAKRASDQANASKDRFLRSLTHDMRTPLHTITGYTDMLVDAAHAGEPVPADVVQARSTRVLAASHELLDMIDRGISLAALSGEGFDVKPQTVMVQALMADLVQELAPRCEAAGLTLENRLPDDLALVADPAYLAVALRQLIENALKFCPRGGAIWVEAGAGAKAGFVEIAVCDDGPGFPLGREDRAFDPFERLGHAMGEISGSGIGLSLVRAQVEAMAGHVGIDASYSDGARVWIRLPAATA